MFAVAKSSTTAVMLHVFSGMFSGKVQYYSPTRENVDWCVEVAGLDGGRWPTRGKITFEIAAQLSIDF